MPGDEPSSQPATPDHPGRAVQQDHGLTRAVRAVSGVTLLSRLGGLVRDIVLVRTFGDTAIGSAFAAAFAIPNMFRRLFGEGALSAAFVPEYTSALGERPADEARPHESDRFASLVIAFLGLATGAITVVVELVLVGLLLFSGPNAEQRQSIGLIMAMLPFMPLVCMTAIKAGMLQVHGRFGASMSGPLVLNAFIIVIGGYYWLTGQKGGATVAYVLAGATVLSGLTQLVYFARLLRPSFRFVMPGPGGEQWRSARPRARVMLRRFVPVMLGLGTLQVNTFVDTLIAMWPIWIGPTLLGFAYPLDASSNAIMNFTQRLYQFPLGVFGVAVATAAFPMLSRHANDPEKFLHTVQRGVRLSLFIGLPASVGLALVREDATAVLFGFGKTGFSPDGLVRSAAVLLGFATGIWAYSLNHFWARVFYSNGDTRTPMLVSVAMVLLNVSLNFTLIWRLKEAGLAWSTSLCAIIQCLVLAVLARRYTDNAHRQGARAVFDVATTRGMAKIALATIIMGLGVWLIHPMLGPRTSWTQHAVGLCVSIGVGALLFGAACFLMRIHEARWLMHRDPPVPRPAMQPDTD